jgi:hypothetical protein
MVNTAHRFMVAATIDTLPISKPLKKNKYPAAYIIAAIADKMITRKETLKFIVKIKASRNTDNKPANCDQKKGLKGPICLAKTPPRKSYIPHPNMPPTPKKMLKMVVFMSAVHLPRVSIE